MISSEIDEYESRVKARISRYDKKHPGFERTYHGIFTTQEALLQAIGLVASQIGVYNVDRVTLKFSCTRESEDPHDVFSLRIRHGEKKHHYLTFVAPKGDTSIYDVVDDYCEKNGDLPTDIISYDSSE